MARLWFPLTVVTVCTVLGACQTAPDRPTSVEADTVEPVPHVVTADIQQGIENHIDEQARLGGGWFTLPHEGRDLRLKLVKVHTEYLANLGPRRHFACVDLVSAEGNVYDVDFFLAGDPGAMSVTETTVHKLNGQPYYVWDQKPDRTWVRTEVESASRHHLGVINGSDEFEFLYQARLPKLTEPAQMWIPLPATDEFQQVDVKSIVAPGRQEILEDKEFGNQVLYLTLDPRDSGRTVAIRFGIRRLEKSVYQDATQDPQRYLAPDRLVPEDDEFRRIAGEVVEGKEDELIRARALYDHVIDRMRYAKFDKKYGQGDAVYACDSRTGNCSDYHSYFIALARAAGIPSRFAIGAAIPSARNEGGISGYHCWAEFYADDKWWPIDVSEADKHDSLIPYYFGHHPANRVELSRGRDLVVEPGPVSGPINFLAYPVLEVGGKPVKVKPRFSFVRSADGRS
ncbi:MAG: transglutaminase [Phycisphaeraceae bacterium]|nr:transglutaminase [Phycisphaeraceae bacterium]